MSSLKDSFARLIAFRNNIPEKPGFGLISLNYIDEYHRIVSLIEEITEENLNEYKIPSKEINPRVTSWNMLSGKQTYSAESYCEKVFLCMKVDALIAKFTIDEKKTQIGFTA